MKIKLLVALLASSLWCGWAQAQDFNSSYNFVAKGTQGPGTSFANTQVSAFAISWNTSATVATCALQVDSSADGITWGSADLIASQNCAVVGSVAATALAAGKNFVRINVTTLVGNGGLNVNLKGYASSGSSTVSPSAPGRSIDPTSATYGAKFDVGTAPIFSTTSGSNIVTCSTCKFQTGTIASGNPPAIVGQLFFANQGTGTSCLDNADITFGALRQTTILSVDSDTQLHVVGNSGNTVTATGCGAWGDDDTTAINAAWNAGGCTSTQWLPIGKAFISAPIWQLIAGCPSVANAGLGYQASRIWGSNVTGTYIIPLPLFNFTSITGGCGPTTSASTCTAAIGNPNVSDYENFEVWGLGARCSATLANTTLWLIGLSTRFINAAGVGWCGRGGGATLIGNNINGQTDIYTYAGTNFFGSIQVNFNAQNIYFGNSAITGNNFATVGACVINLASSSATVTSLANVITGDVCIGAGAVWNSQNTNIVGQDSAGACMTLAGNSIANFLANDNICVNPATNEEAIFFGQSSGTNAFVRAANSNITSAGTAPCIVNAANNTFIDQQDNVFTCGNGKTNGLGNFVGDGSLTNAPPTVSSGFGTSPAILKNSGPASFTVNVGTGGVATAGVIGLPTAINGWTCAVGNQTAHSGHRADDTVQTANTTASVTVENQTKSTGAAVAWTASDTLNLSCRAN